MKRRFYHSIPANIRTLVRRYLSLLEHDRKLWAAGDPFVNELPNYDVPGSPYTFGILREFAHNHQFFIAACREMGYAYRLIDITASDWIERIRQNPCDAYLTWSSAYLTIWKDMYDERLRILEEDLGKFVYPSPKELWLWESKRRMRDWLAAHNIPFPATWVFYDEAEALEFISTAPLPLVSKTNSGAVASGVRILRTRAQAVSIVREAFRQGIAAQNRDKRDRQWGHIILQEYLPDVQEWRMVRIGDAYFGYRKERAGEFHSGSHRWSFLNPPRPLLDLLKRVTDIGGFTSMDVDIFETPDGRLFVNELQSIFGAYTPAEQLVVNGEPGRYRYDDITDTWVFIPGACCQNQLANLRIEYLVQTRLANRIQTKKIDCSCLPSPR